MKLPLDNVGEMPMESRKEEHLFGFCSNFGKCLEYHGHGEWKDSIPGENGIRGMLLLFMFKVRILGEGTVPGRFPGLLL